MKNYSIAKSRRLRSTPYTSRIEKQGVTAYTVYNHMLLPAAFGSIEDSYEHLKKDVHRHLNKLQRKTLWDFIERNVDHCLVTNKFVLDYLEGKYPHCYHGYFYVESEKFLTPIYMIAQKGIDKVIKFVKVRNGSNKKTARA